MNKNATRAIFLLFVLFFVFSFRIVYTADAVSARSVYIGGFPITVDMENRGAIVVGEQYDENNFPYSILRNPPLKRGDIITAIDNKQVVSISDVDNIMAGNTDGKDVVVSYKRGMNAEMCTVYPVREECSGKYKLGYWLKDKIFGLGTVTFLCENKVFAALGHSIIDDETGVKFDCLSGSVYECKLIGVEKGKSGQPGRLKGKCVNCMYPKGALAANDNVGLYGRYTGDISSNGKYEIASSSEVKIGGAKIMSTVENNPQLFDIEIVRAFKQNHSSEKGMVIKIIDQKLLSLTGGIVQGMSGSPILQGGKIVGAVTHVFTNNPTMGYAVYSEWMLERAKSI